MLSETSKVAVAAKLLALCKARLPVATGLLPSGGNKTEPLTPETMLPKFMSRVFVIKIGETTMQVMFAYATLEAITGICALTLECKDKTSETAANMWMRFLIRQLV